MTLPTYTVRAIYRNARKGISPMPSQAEDLASELLTWRDLIVELAQLPPEQAHSIIRGLAANVDDAVTLQQLLRQG